MAVRASLTTAINQDIQGEKERQRGMYIDTNLTVFLTSLINLKRDVKGKKTNRNMD